MLMGLLDDLLDVFRKKEELVEFPEEEEEKKQILVRVETLKDFVDTERISRLLKDGNIVFLKVAELQRHDLGEFRNCVEKLKRNSRRFNWDIVGIEEGYLILTPPAVRIER